MVSLSRWDSIKERLFFFLLFDRFTPVSVKAAVWALAELPQVAFTATFASEFLCLFQRGKDLSALVWSAAVLYITLGVSGTLVAVESWQGGTGDFLLINWCWQMRRPQKPLYCRLVAGDNKLLSSEQSQNVKIVSFPNKARGPANIPFW